jgi:hypothetical protein
VPATPAASYKQNKTTHGIRIGDLSYGKGTKTQRRVSSIYFFSIILYFVNIYNKNPFILKNNILDQSKLSIIYIQRKKVIILEVSISTQCVILFTALQIESLSKKTKDKQYHNFSNKDKRQNN